MTEYRFLGTGTTDENGVAVLEEDADGNPINGYTGVGAGEMDFIASTSNPITDSSLVSETYEVLDCINIDNATETDHNDIWTGNTEDLTRQTNDSLFSSTASRLIRNNILVTGDFIALIEVKGTSSPMIGVVDENNNRTRSYITNSDEFMYYKIIREDNTITIQRSADNLNWSNITLASSDVTSQDCYFMLQNNSGTKSITFKNFKIYPI